LVLHQPPRTNPHKANHAQSQERIQGGLAASSPPLGRPVLQPQVQTPLAQEHQASLRFRQTPRPRELTAAITPIIIWTYRTIVLIERLLLLFEELEHILHGARREMPHHRVIASSGGPDGNDRNEDGAAS